MGEKQPLGERGRRLALILLMAVVCLASSGIAGGLLYYAALEQQSERLRETAQSHARLIEALARHATEHHSEGAGPVVLAQLRDAHARYAGFGKTGELTLARREGDRIVYLLDHRHYDLDSPKPVPFTSDRSEAMRLALENQSGVLTGLDYRGKQVLSAYEPIAGLGWGITVKMDMAEVRAPFVAAGGIAGVLALLLCIFAALAFSRITDPLIRNLQTSRECLAFALEAGEIGLYDWDLRTSQATCSERYYRMRGLEPGAHVPLDEAWMATIHPEDRAGVREAITRVIESGAPYGSEYRVVLPGGETRWLHSKAIAFSHPGARPHRIIGVAMDVTIHREAEAALREARDALERRVEERTADLGKANAALRAENAQRIAAEERYHMLFTTMLDGFALHEILCDGEGCACDYRFLEVNPAFEELTGLTADRVVGRRVLEVIPDLEREWIEAYGEVALTGKSVRFEQYALPLDKHFEVVAFSPARGLFATVFTDVTIRKQAEAEILRKNRDLETLLYVTSHDLREPLRAIRNFSQMVHDRYADRLDDKGRDFLRRVVAGGERMERLIDDILQLSRAQRTVAPQELLEGRAIVREALQGLESAIQASGARLRVADDLPAFRGDRVWVTRAVFNLIANALKFTREGESPDIEIEPYREGEHGEIQVGIAVCDRGPGVDPEYADRIFGLFQRAVGREVPGTGAGLAIVREVAEKHGGRAWVLPRPGGGSEFTVTFGPAPRDPEA